jgi:hypothetical protein
MNSHRRNAAYFAFRLLEAFLMMYSSVLYQTKLIPRPLATLGVSAAISVFTAALLERFGIIGQISAWARFWHSRWQPLKSVLRFT